MLAESDETIFQRYAATRDAEAFALLVRRHAQMVFATALRITRNRADAEDVTQTCFFDLARSWAPTIRSVPGWLHSVAISRSHDLLRWAGAARRRDLSAHEHQTESSLEQWRELEPEIDKAIDALEETFRAPLILHYLQGVPQVEIARQLGVTQSTVCRRLQQGVEMLRRRLSEAGVVPSLGGLALLLESSRSIVMPPRVQIALGKMSLAGLRPVKVSWGGQGKLAVGISIVVIVLSAVLLWKLNARPPALLQESPVIVPR